MNGLECLREKYPWPEVCPAAEPDPEGWFCGENRAVLQKRIANAKVVLELGAWKGMSTRWLADNSQATVITIDHWKGSSEHQNRTELPQLYEIFVKNCWDYRERLIAMREDVEKGMQIVHDWSIVPDVIYVDASHEADLVANNLTVAMSLWPTAHIVGDDWTWRSVKEGVSRVVAAGNTDPKTGRRFIGRYTCYEFFPEGVDIGF